MRDDLTVKTLKQPSLQLSVCLCVFVCGQLNPVYILQCVVYRASQCRPSATTLYVRRDEWLFLHVCLPECDFVWMCVCGCVCLLGTDHVHGVLALGQWGQLGLWMVEGHSLPQGPKVTWVALLNTNHKKSRCEEKNKTHNGPWRTRRWILVLSVKQPEGNTLMIRHLSIQEFWTFCTWRNVSVLPGGQTM